jgi:DNA-binding transcriptional regulator of glucitol operon
MRRTSLFVSVLAVVLLGVLAVGRAVITTAQDATPPVDGQGFVGSWRVMVTLPQGPSFPSLVTFGTDGTVTTSNQPVQPSPGAPGQVVFASAGHGAWEATGPDTMVFTFVVLLADGQGNLVGFSTTRATLTLGANGQTFSGEGVPTIADPAGNVMVTFRATVQATRIVAEEPGPSAP